MAAGIAKMRTAATYPLRTLDIFGKDRVLVRRTYLTKTIGCDPRAKPLLNTRRNLRRWAVSVHHRTSRSRIVVILLVQILLSQTKVQFFLLKIHIRFFPVAGFFEHLNKVRKKCNDRSPNRVVSKKLPLWLVSILSPKQTHYHQLLQRAWHQVQQTADR